MDGQITDFNDVLNSFEDEDDDVLRCDNSHYFDSNTAQKLSSDDILKLRVRYLTKLIRHFVSKFSEYDVQDDGVNGTSIIKSLIENSDTWATKSEFAQEKWLKRKQRKYLPRLRAMKSTPCSICEVYHNKSRDKILNIRSDSLGIILSQAGIRSGMRVFVFDGAIGLITGAVAYRMGGRGLILASYAGQQPHFELVRALNVREDHASIIQVNISCHCLSSCVSSLHNYSNHSPFHRMKLLLLVNLCRNSDFLIILTKKHFVNCHLRHRLYLAIFNKMMRV